MRSALDRSPMHVSHQLRRPSGKCGQDSKWDEAVPNKEQPLFSPASVSEVRKFIGPPKKYGYPKTRHGNRKFLKQLLKHTEQSVSRWSSRINFRNLPVRLFSRNWLVKGLISYGWWFLFLAFFIIVLIRKAYAIFV